MLRTSEWLKTMSLSFKEPDLKRREIEALSARLSSASTEEREAEAVLDAARVEAGEFEVRMRMLQAQVEAAVTAATTQGDGGACFSVLGQELEALVSRTEEVASLLRIAKEKVKDAEAAHYW